MPLTAVSWVSIKVSQTILPASNRMEQSAPANFSLQTHRPRLWGQNRVERRQEVTSESSYKSQEAGLAPCRQPPDLVSPAALEGNPSRLVKGSSKILPD